MVTDTEIENWIATRIATIVNINPDAVSRESEFDSYGIDSGQAIALMVDLEHWLRLDGELPLELLFEAESIRKGAQNIAAALAQQESLEK